MTELTPYDPKQSGKKKKSKVGGYNIKKNKKDKFSIFFFVIATILFSLCFLCVISPALKVIWAVIGGLILLIVVLLAVCLLFIPFLDEGFRDFIKNFSDSLGNTTMIDVLWDFVVSYGQYVLIAALAFYGISLLLTIKSGKEENKGRYIATLIMLVIVTILLIVLLLLNYTNLFLGNVSGSNTN